MESIQVKPRLAGRMVIIILLSQQTDFHKLAKAYDATAISIHPLRALRLKAFRRSQKYLTAEEQKKIAEVTEKNSRLR